MASLLSTTNKDQNYEFPRNQISASNLLSKYSSGGNPPSDVLDSLGLPTGTKILSHKFLNADLFDEEFKATCPMSPAVVISIFESSLSKNRWKITLSKYTRITTYEITANFPSQDGYYWTAGLDITATSNNYSQISATSYVLQLYETSSE
jgi:hypothetical protein